jgi:hypothetical protein
MAKTKRATKGTKSLDEIGRSTGNPRQKYFLDDAGRELFYRTYDGKSETIDYLAEALQVPRKLIIMWAVQSGITCRYGQADHGHTTASLAEALGVDMATVRNWIMQGWLPGKKSREDYYFSDKDVRAFIVRYPQMIKPTEDNWLWLVDILAGGEHGIGELCDEVS